MFPGEGALDIMVVYFQEGRWGGGDPQNGTVQLLPRIPKSYYSQLVIFNIVGAHNIWSF